MSEHAHGSRPRKMSIEELAVAANESGDVVFFEDRDSSTNTVVITEPGIGTITSLASEVEAAGFVALFITAWSIIDLPLAMRGSGDSVVLHHGVERVDTLVINDPDRLNEGDENRALIAEIARARTAFGRALPKLKRVVLVYTEFPGKPVDSDAVDLGSQYPSVRVTRRRAAEYPHGLLSTHSSHEPRD